ncbi:MAG: extensin family protein [Pseudomonadota bacterium]
MAVVLAVLASPVAAEVCGDARLVGEEVRACGDRLVELRAAAGVSLPDAPVMSCVAAVKLADLAEAPALTQPWPVAVMRTNRGALCESAGAAVDVYAFEFERGWRREIATGWEMPRRRGYLDTARAAACNRFPTVLTPHSGEGQADRFTLSMAPGACQ